MNDPFVILQLESNKEPIAIRSNAVLVIEKGEDGEDYSSLTLVSGDSLDVSGSVSEVLHKLTYG